MAAHPEGQLISAILATGDVQSYRKHGITAEFIHDFTDEWRWLEDHIQRYEGCPDQGDFLDKFPDFTMTNTGGSLPFYIDEVRKSHRRASLLDLTNTTLDLVAAEKYDQAESAVARFMGRINLNGSRGRVRSRLACNVTAEPVVWLWPDRVPMAATTLLEGQPKVGKSTIAVDLAARVSTGRAMPDDADQAATYDPVGVVILSAEDHPGRVIRPRLEAAGADLSRIRIVDGVDDLDDDGTPYLRPVSLPEDLPRVESIVPELPAGLVIIDPLMAFLSSRVKSAVDQDVRRALFPLRELAERTGAAVLIIRHFRKSRDGEAINWGGGSIGIAGAARSVLQVGQDPDHDDRCVLVHTASNFGPESASLAYRIVGMTTKRIDTSAIEWHGESTVKPEDLGSSRGPGRPADIREEVAAWLEDELASGADLRQKIITKAAVLGYAEATVQRAARELQIKRSRQGMEVVWGLEDP